MVIDNNFFMSLALKEAWKYQGLTYPNPAVGCCIVSSTGAILAVEAHQKAGQPHAEVRALQSAYYKLTNDNNILQLTLSDAIHQYLIKHANFENISLYTTLEPCSHIGKTPSCANLIASLKIKKVFTGANDFNPLAACGNKKLLESGVEVITNVLEEECKGLLEPFRLWTKNNFIFFKWAQRLNGTTDAGTISSRESHENVHAMRDVCDLLVIGGNTVRSDRPTLDARLVNGKAPDILILSRGIEFDKTIPLFSIKDRKVIISNDLSLCSKYKNIMIEGSSGMYELTRDYIDMYLCYISPKLGGSEIINTKNDELSILNVEKALEDTIIWMKKEV